MSDLDLIYRGVSVMLATEVVDFHTCDGQRVFPLLGLGEWKCKDTPGFLEFTEDFMVSGIERNGRDWKMSDDVADELRDGWFWTRMHPSTVRDSAAYWIEPDLCTVIDHAGHYLPETFFLHDTMVPDLFGVVTFGADVAESGETDGCSVAWWARGDGGLVIRALHLERHRPPRTTLYALPWGRIPDGQQVPRALAAFWLFIDQKLPRTERRQAPRHLRRGDLRDAPTLHTTTICTLRRREARPGEPRPTDVDWSHRWLVSGHWREQYYPSTDEHHTIWISPYVKGPDELPLVHKDRAFLVIR